MRREARMTLTMRQLEQAAEQYIRDLYRRLGVRKPVQSARVYPAVLVRGRVWEYFRAQECRRRGNDNPRSSQPRRAAC